MGRVLLFGAAWVACLATLVLLIGGPRSPARTAAVSARTTLSPPPPPPPPRVGARYPGWTVTRAYSAHHMMVVEVETDRATKGSSIAAQIVEPLKDRYDEVLVYIRNPDQQPDDLPARRIQWTRRAGYVESVYER